MFELNIIATKSNIFTFVYFRQIQIIQGFRNNISIHSIIHIIYLTALMSAIIEIKQ